MSESLRERLVTANRIVANEGIVSGFGHVSVRNPDTNTMLLSRSLSPAFVTTDDILELTLDGEVVEDNRTPYLENVIHRSIYRERPDVNAVVHHHAPSVVPFTATDAEIKPAYHQGMLFHDGVPTFSSYDPEYGMLVATEAEGKRMAETLSDHRAQLLEGHGANVVGANLKEVIASTVHFVNNARNQLAAMSIGELTFDTSEEVAQTTVEEAILSDVPIERLWTYLVRRLPEQPSTH